MAIVDWSNLVDSLASGVWVLDGEGTTIFANRALAAMLRYSPGDICGRHFTSFMAPADVAQAAVYWERRLGGVSESHEFRFVRADGQPLWVLVEATVVEQSDGSACYAAVITDVSAYRAEHLAKRTLGENFSRFIRESPYPIVVSDLDGHICQRNPAFDAAFAPEDGDAHLDTVCGVRPTERGWGGSLAAGGRPELLVINKGMSWRDVILPLHGVDGVRSALHVFVDVTERLLGLERVRRSEDSWRAVADETARALRLRALAIDVTTDGMAILQGDTYVFLNRSHEQMYGWEAGELIGRSWRELYTESTQYWIETQVFAEVQRNGRWRGDVVGKRKDGSPIETEVSLAMSGDGHLVCCCRDVSVRKRLERELRVSLQLAGVDNKALRRAKEEADLFMACMSHELRTPLHSILGIAELLTNSVDEPPTDTQHRLLQQLVSTGGHFLDLINDLLDVSRLSIGELPLDISSVQMEYVLGTALDIVRRAAAAKDIALRRIPDRAVSVSVRGDQRRLVQILVNLLSNAIKFTPAGGTVGVHWERRDDSIVVDVVDSGIGIPQHELRNLFQPFHQIDRTLARQNDGVGLGLYLAHKLVTAQGGIIEVESQLDTGSRFSLRLPIES